jgi:hypothetical protein
MEAINGLNLAPRGNSGETSTNNPTFGRIHSIVNTPRQFQFAAKSYFESLERGQKFLV